MRKLSENERRILAALATVPDGEYLPGYRLPNGRRSDARARAILALYRLGLIEGQYDSLHAARGENSSLSFYNQRSEADAMRLTDAGRVVASDAGADKERE